MTDLIKIPKNIFYSYKDKYSGCESDITKKYDLIYAKYTCFTNPPVVIAIKSSRKHHVVERKYAANKDIYKTILGFLNVLNATNYIKIVNKLSILINVDTIQIIVNEILRICTIQIFYIKLYIRLLRDLVDRCCSAERIIAYLCIKKYGADYFTKKEWIYDKKHTGGTVYADFCLLQKFKTHILAKNVLLLQLHQEFDNQLVPTNYITELFDDIVSMTNNQDNITLILEILLELMPFKNAPCDVHAKLDAIQCDSKKNQFIIQELKRLYDA